MRRALRELERNELANKGEPPINLVPMIDILTVLVLYLLVGSIYEHLAVLQLNLPATQAAATTDDKPVLQPTVIIRRDWLEVRDRRGIYQRLDNSPAGYDLEALAGRLLEIKRQAPRETSITLLLEPEISYDTLVQIMDGVRLLPADNAPAGLTELFPAISIGDAPKSRARP